MGKKFGVIPFAIEVFLGAFLGWSLFNSNPAEAFELSASSGVLQLPASSSLYATYDLQGGLGSFESQFIFEFGLCAESIYYGQLGWQWTTRLERFFHPFASVGVGLFNDPINNNNGVDLSLVMEAGIKMGSPRFGMKLAMSAYLGVYDPNQLGQFEVWPMTRFTGGLYVEF